MTKSKHTIDLIALRATVTYDPETGILSSQSERWKIDRATPGAYRWIIDRTMCATIHALNHQATIVDGSRKHYPFMVAIIFLLSSSK